jgi:hypothetical protein
MAIQTIDALKRHVGWARRIELSLMAPYLYAMYSLKDETSDAYATIRSVALEEMLHLALGSNLAVALGDRPRFYDPTLVQAYPSPLLHRVPELVLHLAPCSIEVVRDTFMAAEKPQAVPSIPESEEYQTVGQFYEAVAQGFALLGQRYPDLLFAGNVPARQLVRGYGPVAGDVWGSGHLIGVVDLASAFEAISFIVRQGEGVLPTMYADVQGQELAHYDKFAQIASGRLPLGEVWPLAVDPRAASYPEPVRGLAELWNASFSYMLMVLDQLYWITDPAQRTTLTYLGMVMIMNRVLKPVAELLVRQPIADGVHAGPTFELFRFTGPPRAELVAMAAALEGSYPALAPIRGILAGLPELFMV